MIYFLTKCTKPQTFANAREHDEPYRQSTKRASKAFSSQSINILGLLFYECRLRSSSACVHLLSAENVMVQHEFSYVGIL